MGSLLSRTDEGRPRIDGRKVLRIVMLGLDDAGKTTILYRMNTNGGHAALPGSGFNVERIDLTPSVSFDLYEVEGREKRRAAWPHFCESVDGLIYVVDCHDRQRMDETRDELQRIVSLPSMSRVPIVILGNKQDLPRLSLHTAPLHRSIDRSFVLLFCSEAMKAEHLVEKLALAEMCVDHRWVIEGTSAVTGEGLLEGLLSMSDLLVSGVRPSLC